MPLDIYITTDNRVKLTGLHDPAYASTHASYYVNDATVTFLLKDSTDTNTVSGTSITLSYITSSDGDYAGSFPSTVTLTDGTNYYARATISRSGQDVLIRKLCRATYYEGEE